MNLDEIQQQTEEWREEKHPEADSMLQLAGATQELGEVAELLTKRRMGYDGYENIDEDLEEEIGDVLIFLCGLASKEDLDIDRGVNTAAEKVLNR